MKEKISLLIGLIFGFAGVYVMFFMPWIVDSPPYRFIFYGDIQKGAILLSIATGFIIMGLSWFKTQQQS